MAEETKVGDVKIEKTTETAKAGETQEERKFSQKELDEIIGERLKKEKKTFEKTLSEEKRLAALTAEEQERERFKKEKEEFENDKKEISREKMKMEISRQMGTENLPSEFAEYLLVDDADKAKENIKKFKKTWETALSKAVDDRIKGKTPAGGQALPQGKISSADVAKMSDAERLSYKAKNPDWWKY